MKCICIYMYIYLHTNVLISRHHSIYMIFKFIKHFLESITLKLLYYKKKHVVVEAQSLWINIKKDTQQLHHPEISFAGNIFSFLSGLLHTFIECFKNKHQYTVQTIFSIYFKHFCHNFFNVNIILNNCIIIQFFIFKLFCQPSRDNSD